jgi:hypothetical protein
MKALLPAIAIIALFYALLMFAAVLATHSAPEKPPIHITSLSR